MMDERTPFIFHQVIGSPPSSMVGSELVAAISDRNRPDRERLSDFHYFALREFDQWWEVTEQLLKSDESDVFKTTVLMTLSGKFCECDPQSDYPLVSRLKLVQALQQLPHHLGRHYTPLHIRAYLGDDTVLSDLNHLSEFEQIATLGMLRTPKAVEYLNAKLARAIDKYDRRRIAVQLGRAGDSTGIADLREGLLDSACVVQHLQFACALALLGDSMGMMYMLPLLEIDEETKVDSHRLTSHFQSDRKFADPRNAKWRVKLIRSFRERIRLTHQVTTDSCASDLTLVRLQQLVEAETLNGRIVAATLGYGEPLFLDLDRAVEANPECPDIRTPPATFETNFASWILEGPIQANSEVDSRGLLDAAANSLIGKIVESVAVSVAGAITLVLSGSQVLRIEPWSIDKAGRSDAWSLRLPPQEILAASNDGQFVIVDEQVPVKDWFTC